MLPDVTLPITISLEHDGETKTFQLSKLNLVRQDRIQKIRDFIKQNTNIRPRETVHIIETLFKQRARNERICIRNQYYDRRRQLDDLGQIFFS